MNVLLISGAAGGVGRHITDLAAFLLVKKYNVTLLYSGKRSDPHFSKRLEILESMGCKLKRIDFNRRIGLMDFFVSMRVIFFTLKSGAFDIIHGHSSKGGLYARILGFFSRAKIIYTPHAFYTMSPGNNKILNWLIRMLEFLMGYLTFKIIVTSEQEMEHLSYLHINKNKALLIPNGSFKSPFDDIQKPLLCLDPTVDGAIFTIGFVGRFCYQKNLDLAVEIFEKCVSEDKNLRLVLVGSGEDESRIRALVENSQFANKVIFVGDKSVGEVMPSFNLLLVTSRYEGSPYLFQDAAKYGVPIISTDVGGVEFFVKHGINGFVFSYSDEAAKLILSLVNNPKLVESFSKESAKIASYYSWTRMGNEVIGLYGSPNGMLL